MAADTAAALDPSARGQMTYESAHQPRDVQPLSTRGPLRASGQRAGVTRHGPDTCKNTNLELPYSCVRWVARSQSPSRLARAPARRRGLERSHESCRQEVYVDRVTTYVVRDRHAPSAASVSGRLRLLATCHLAIPGCSLPGACGRRSSHRLRRGCRCGALSGPAPDHWCPMTR